tara:strand:- start:905 stop:2815 length:1911 start_codon:yes stop_codon:yes gene_type:complete
MTTLSLPLSGVLSSTALGGFLFTPDIQGISIPVGSRIVEIGTSLTDNGYRDHTEGATIRGYGSRGAMNYVRLATNQAFEYYNVGIGGDTIDDMLNRYMFDVLPLEPDFVFVDAGTNDSTKTFEEYKTGLTELYAVLGSTGATVIPYQIPYRGAPTSNAVNDLYAQVNEWIVANYPVNIDTNKYFSDLAIKRPLGNYTVDGIHYSNDGAYAVSRAVLEAVTFSNGDILGTPLNTNPALSGSGGSQDALVSGTMPDGYHMDILFGSATMAVDTDLGHLRGVITPVSGASTFRIRGDAVTSGTDGSLYEFISSFKLSDWDGWEYFQLRMIRSGNPVVISSYDMRQESSLDDWAHQAWADFQTSRTEYIYQTEDTTNFTPYIEFGIRDGVTGTGTFEVNNWQVQEFTPPVFTDVASTVPDIEVGFRANIANIEYNNGTEIVSVSGKHGVPFDVVSTSFYPDYDATAFDNRGGVIVDQRAERLIANANIPADCTVYGVFDLLAPDGANNYDIFAFGTTSTGDLETAVNKFLQSIGQNRWYGREGTTASEVVGASGNDYRNTRIAIIAEFKNGFLNYWLNDGVNALELNMDINDTYIDRGRLIMGGGHQNIGELWISHATFADMHITPEQLMNDMTARWGIT